MSTREDLQKLRGHIAYSKQMKPYMVFRDEELELLLEKRPTTISSLCKIKGFPKGGARVIKYGEAIISVFLNNGKDEMNFVGDDKINVVLSNMSLF